MKPALFLLAPLLLAAAPSAERARERELMVLTVANMAETAGPESRRLDPAVLRAMREVPRHLFVPEELRRFSYENRPLPIGHEQTISQPYIVAFMTHVLKVRPGDNVLEIGTGSGYQAAILSRLVRQVHTIEIVDPLAAQASRRLRELGYSNVEVRSGDGYAGWPERAPFYRIIVTAGADHIPKPLLDQLRPGGRMVIPLGRKPDTLELTLVEKDARGRVRKRVLLPVRFVPLTRLPR
ncbi:MAG TPA: protein-L-isoaspartate(D-aspartate) O-methyltransferase [Allosphingosinicella sp.]|nr:protein-L-isoaspartate(D-aspartate) O-methyltransferase [Allosphingosinicella sp.]